MTESKANRRPARRREEVLALLREAHRPLGVAEIARRIGVHANTVRFHLEALAADGRVEHIGAGHGSPGRPARLYRPVQGMDPVGPRHYRALAEALADGLAGLPDPRRRAVEAGRSWGRRRAMDTPADNTADPVSRLTRVLTEMDFSPERPADTAHRIDLRHCPFLELALKRREVVCSLHLGLMQGAMRAWGSDIGVERLDAFVEPDRCSAHLGGAPAASAPDSASAAPTAPEHRASARSGGPASADGTAPAAVRDGEQYG